MAKKYLDDVGLRYLWSKIKSLFIAKTGGTMTGPLDVQNELSANYGNLGNLTVTGDSTFVNPIRGNLNGNADTASSIAWTGVTGKPDSTGNSKTGISIANHGTGTVIGVQSSTTTASKVTLGTAFSIPNVTAAGSGSASLTMAMDTTDKKKLKITFSHTHTPPTLGTAFSVPNVTGNANVTVPIKNTSASTFVTGTTHTITDNGHTHTIS